MSKIKISKISKIKIHISEKRPWNPLNGSFCFLKPVWSKEGFSKAAGSTCCNENKTSNFKKKKKIKKRVK